MPKRFITTELFRDPWFLDLPLKYKAFWVFLLTECNHAGIWTVCFKQAKFNVGEDLESAECERHLSGRIIKLENGKYWFIKKFILFQYGDTLNPKNRVHNSVLHELLNHNIIKNCNLEEKEGVWKVLASPIDGAKDKEKDKDKELFLFLKQEETPEEKNKRHPLQEWVDENAPKVNKIKSPLTADECKRLLDEFDEADVKETLLAMENYKKFTQNYDSANLTLRNWLKRRTDEGKIKMKRSPPFAQDTFTYLNLEGE